MRIAAERRSQAGFTLIEVIVALIIAVMGLIAMFKAISGGMMSVEIATQHTTAIRYAQSHLEELGVTRPLRSGEQRGTEKDGYTWSLRITPLASHSRSEKRDSLPLTLFAVEAVVSWKTDKRERSVRLESYRLGSTDPVAERSPMTSP